VPNRRELLKASFAAPFVSVENRKPGTTDWQLTRLRLDKAGGFRSPWIEGYCSHQSIEAGQTLEIKISTNTAARFQIEIFRMGYYGGAGARRMAVLGPFAGKVQPDPEIGERRLRLCQWDTSARIQIPNDWPSGVYLGRLTLTEGAPWQSYAIFAVRDRRKADILFQVSDNTWQADNVWPDKFSLYTHPKGSLYSRA
jgi:hypothetical protein